MDDEYIPPEYYGWWRIAVTSLWDGNESTFIAEKADNPDEPIPDPPSHRDKWSRRW